MRKNFTDDIGSDSSYFHPTPLNTSCTGGTVNDISISTTSENSGSVNYILSYKELSSFHGLETIDKKEADNIINSLYQLSMITYQVFHHD
jgi:hypothetical protein